MSAKSGEIVRRAYEEHAQTALPGRLSPTRAHAPFRWLATRTATSAVLLAVLAVAACQGTQGHQLRPGPAGLAFYDPPARLVEGEHGSVIWIRRLDAGPALPRARNYLVLYSSRNQLGKTVAVSGTLAVPDGKPPKNGWPLISWAHGTTGVARICAPSLDTSASYPAHDYTSVVDQVLARWVAHGFAVAQTDYQGLGTVGPHGYIIGEMEMRAVADMARAARQVDHHIGTRWVVIGHSQGGQAAAFTDALAKQWVPDLELLGAVALAPGSQFVQVLNLIRNMPTANPASAFIPLLIRGVQTVAPVKPAAFLAPAALRLLPLADEGCIAQLRGPNQWGGIAGAEAFQLNADVSTLDDALAHNDPSHLLFAKPLLVLQGASDTTVPKFFSDLMVAEMTAHHDPVRYQTYEAVDHRSVLAASFDDALVWVTRLFGR